MLSSNFSKTDKSKNLFTKKFLCRGCNSKNNDEILSFGNKPIVHHLKNTPLQPDILYDFTLIYCFNCNLLQIKNPIDSNLLYKNYHTFSGWKNQNHCNNLIYVLEKLFNPDSQSSILEIGSNDGSFIKLLNSKGYHNIVGYEPTKDAFEQAKNNNIILINEFFNSKNLDYLDNKKFDIVITRHVLEHIVDIEDFLNSTYCVLNDDGILLIEVPDSLMNFEYLDYALWEEHVNYFTINSIKNILKNYNFHIIHYEVTLYSGRSMIIFCKKTPNNFKNYFNNDDINIIEKYKNSFPILKERINSDLANEKNLYVYGCGNRSSNFVNFFELNNIINFIDDQKEKQGLFVPGSNAEILSPENKNFNGLYLIGVNTENENKVISKLKNFNSSYYSILPPSRLLPNYWIDLLN